MKAARNRLYVVHKCWWKYGGTQHWFSELLPKGDAIILARKVVNTRPPYNKANLEYVVVEKDYGNRDVTPREKIKKWIFIKAEKHEKRIPY
jgi:hypothetical protein